MPVDLVPGLFIAGDFLALLLQSRKKKGALYFKKLNEY